MVFIYYHFAIIDQIQFQDANIIPLRFKANRPLVTGDAGNWDEPLVSTETILRGLTKLRRNNNNEIIDLLDSPDLNKSRIQSLEGANKSLDEATLYIEEMVESIENIMRPFTELRAPGSPSSFYDMKDNIKTSQSMDVRYVGKKAIARVGDRVKKINLKLRECYLLLKKLSMKIQNWVKSWLYIMY